MMEVLRSMEFPKVNIQSWLFMCLQSQVNAVQVVAGENAELNFYFPEYNAQLQEFVVKYGNPAHTANASVFYTFPAKSTFKNFNAGCNAYYVDDRLAGCNPSLTNPNYKLITQPDYTLFDIALGYSGLEHFSNHHHRSHFVLA